MTAGGTSNGDDAVPEWFSLYLDVEPAAAQIRTYEYAREVYWARNPDDGPAEIERRVPLRMERQAILTRGDPARPGCTSCSTRQPCCARSAVRT